MKAFLKKQSRQELIMIALFLAGIIATWLLFSYRIDEIDAHLDLKNYTTH